MTQEEYIAILFDECSFSGAQRRDFLGLRFGGRRYADQLTVAEKHQLIEDLKDRKVQPVASEEDDDDGGELTAMERFKKRLK